MKKGKLFASISIILLAFVFSNINATDLQKSNDPQGESTKSFTVSKGGKLYVNVNPGDIKISTWDKNEVVVKVRGVEESELKNVSMTLSNNTVTVKYNPEWGWSDDVEFMFNIPVQFNVEAKTSGGDVKISSSITGEVEISSMGGDVSVQNVNGKATLSTQGGDVNTGNISGSLSLKTMGGDVKVGNVSGDYAKVTTMGGEITIGKVSSGINAVTYGGDIKIDGIGGDADIETMGGDISLKDIKGKVTMETKGGSITVKNCIGSLKANTYGGELDLRGISGSVDANSMSGDVYVEMNPSSGSKSRISTMNGEIELRLPSNAKADISAEIKGYGNWKYMKDEYSIDSDFPAKASTGESGKKITGEYTVNGGGATIILKSTNGSIKIKKSNK